MQDETSSSGGDADPTQARAERPVRVLQVLNQLGVGGIEQWLLQMLRHLDRERFEVDVALAEHHRSRYFDQIEALGFKILPLPRSTVRSYPRNFRALVDRHGPYDIVHAHVAMHSGPLMRAARMAGIPVRITHSHSSGYGAPGRPLRQKIYEWTCRRWMLRHSTHLLAVASDAGDSLFGPGITDDPRFGLSRAGIDLTPFREPPVSDVTRDSLGIPDGAALVGHVGRFTEQKNHEFLVRVAAEIVKRHNDVYFVLIGEGRDREQVEGQIADLGLMDHFRLLGTRHDVPALLRTLMDLFLLPSRYEGLPRAAVEAQAAGLPCVISERLTTETDLIAGLITRVPLSDGPGAWADKLLQVLDAEREVSREEALDAVSASDFNIETGARKLQQLWLDAAAAAAGDRR